MSEVREVCLGDGFGEVAVKVNGATIEVHADGSLAAHTAGDVDVYTNAAVRVHPAANDTGKAVSVAPVELKPGDRMEDGTIFAGLSPDTHRPMYTTSDDAPMTMMWEQAMEYAARLEAHGHQDWRVPTKNELNVLFYDRAAIDGFNETGEFPMGWYWSSARENDSLGWGQRFSDGTQNIYGIDNRSSLRCVRG